MNVRSSFETTLDQDWCDWTTRRIYGDWLEEHDQPDLPFAQRWMAGRELAPANRVPYMARRVTKPWAWCPPDGPTEVQAPQHSRLPYALFLTLIGSQYFVGHRFYRRRTEAEQDLARALKALKHLLEPDRK